MKSSSYHRSNRCNRDVRTETIFEDKRGKVVWMSLLPNGPNVNVISTSTSELCSSAYSLNILLVEFHLEFGWQDNSSS